MNRFLTYIILVPCLSGAGTLYYSDEPAPSVREEAFPERLFDHPEFEDNYDIKEAYYLKDKKETKKIVYKKESSFFDFNFGYSNLTVQEVTPFYYPQNYTQQIQTVNNTGAASTSASTGSVTTQQLTINESYAQTNLGNFDVTFPSKLTPVTYPDPTQQPSLQINMFTRSKHLGYGLEASYINSPTITVPSATNPDYPLYTITQTQTTTTTGSTTSPSGTTTSSVGTAVSIVTAPVALEKLTLKVVNVPLHFSMSYFPIYDGYIQPYLKAGLGLNLTHTVMDVSMSPNSQYTLIPLHQEGWAFMPFTYTYGGGIQLMLTENFALSFSYLKMKINGRSTRFKVILQQPISGDYAVTTGGAYPNAYSNTYGDMRFEFKQKTTITEVGIVLYL